MACACILQVVFNLELLSSTNPGLTSMTSDGVVEIIERIHLYLSRVAPEAEEELAITIFRQS